MNPAAESAGLGAAMRVEVIHPIDLSRDHMNAWTAMRAANPAFNNPLLSVEFTQAIGRWRSDTRVAVVYSNGAIAGFLPFQKRPDGFARPVGAPFSDFQALISAGPLKFSVQEVFHAAGIKYFKATCLIDPHHLFEASPLQRISCATLDVPEDPAATFDILLQNSAQRFKRMRRLERKIVREIGEIEIAVCDRNEGVFKQVLDWKSAQYAAAGLHDVLKPAWVQGLMRELFQNDNGKLRGCVLSLRAGGKLVAGEFGVIEGANLHPWIASYDAGASLYSPGTMLRFLLINEMPKHGLRTYDMGPSLESYKAFFQTGERVAYEGWVTSKNKIPGHSIIDAIPNERARGVAARVLNRLDHIAAAEITAAGRAKGFVAALRGMRSRLEAAAPEEPKD